MHKSLVTTDLSAHIFISIKYLMTINHNRWQKVLTTWLVRNEWNGHMECQALLVYHKFSRSNGVFAVIKKILVTFYFTILPQSKKNQLVYLSSVKPLKFDQIYIKKSIHIYGTKLVSLYTMTYSHNAYFLL
jgi:hypothetical protein